MRPIRGTSAFAHRPNTPAIAAWCLKRWPKRWERPHERTPAPDRPADFGAWAWNFSLGGGGARFRHPAVRSARTRPCSVDPDRRRRPVVEFAAGDTRHDVRRSCPRRRWGHRRRDSVQPVTAGRVFALSLCGDLAGDAGRRHRAPLAGLSAATAGRARLRLDRRVLPCACQYNVGPVVRRSQSYRAVRALQGLALADTVAAEIAGGIAAGA